MLEEIKNIKSEKSDLRNFGIIVGIILLIISGFLFWKEKESFQIFLAIGITLFIDCHCHTSSPQTSLLDVDDFWSHSWMDYDTCNLKFIVLCYYLHRLD